jgi:hypothetical protein
MEAVGGEVIVVLSIPLITIAALALYYRHDLCRFVKNQFQYEVRIEENEDERHDREHMLDADVCSICLSQPKVHEVSSSCSHSFCGECVMALYLAREQQIKCPLCRQDIHMLFRLFQSSDATKEI